MKDQYFGDVNDYRKYGLLRAILAVTRLRLGVCWMLTEPDSRTDGGRLAYLYNPKKFRLFDHELYDWLQQTMQENSNRRTSRIEATDLLACTVYFAAPLTDGPARRKAWFVDCCRRLHECDLVFFDPDNGLERSIIFGRRHSHKFLYLAEVRQTFSAGSSVLIYQQFPRESRAAYIEELVERLRTETGATAVFSFSTPHVLFLLAAQERHAASFRDVVRRLPLSWPEREIAAREVQQPPVSSTADPSRLSTGCE